MPNSIKYSTTGDTLSLKKGNFFIGVGDVGKGPSNLTGHYQGITPPPSGYTIYVNTAGSQTSIFCANSDAELIRFTNGFSGQNFITATQCLNWYATQTNYVCVNEDYESIVTNGLVLNLDAGFTPSYTSSGTTWYDLSYSGNNGTLVNGPTFNSANGGSIVFDGVDDVVTTSLNTLQPNTTWNVWVNRIQSNNVYNMIMGMYLPYFAFRSNGDIHFSNQIGGTQRSLYAYPNLVNNVWYFMTFVSSFSGGNTTMLIYLNGNLLSQQIYNGQQPTTTVNSFRLGNWRPNMDGYNFNGKISQVQIYNRALGSSEVLQNYQAQFPRFLGQNVVMNGLVEFLDAGYNGSYRTSGTTWTNISGVSGGTGTLTNGPTYSTDGGGSIVFDGVDDYFTTSNYNDIVFGNGDFSANIWMKFPISSVGEGGAWGPIISKGCTTSAPAGTWWVAQNSTNTNSVALNISSTAGGTFVCTLRSGSLNNGWNNVFVMRQGSTSSMYINGVFHQSDNTSESNLQSTRPLTLCATFTTNITTQRTNASLSSVMLYNRALTQSEILQNYQAQFPQILGENIITNGLVLYLDAGYRTSYPTTGTTWNNVSGVSGGTGTLTNGPTYDSANGGVIDFDGVDDFVLGNTNLGLSADPSFTISYFARWDGASFSANYPSGVGNNSTGVSNRGLSTTWQNGRIALDFWVNRFRADVALNVQTWYHVAFTKSPGLIGTTSKLYVNGVEVSGSVEGTNTTPNITDSPLVVGRLDNTRWFNGKINNVSIYNRTLTANEILQNFNAQKSRFGL
jgi:energy-coupling factor transporter ATP-binding protein EcfA2